MAELTLISPSRRLLQPLVEGALRNELRLLEASIRRSEQTLQALVYDPGSLRSVLPLATGQILRSSGMKLSALPTPEDQASSAWLSLAGPRL